MRGLEENVEKIHFLSIIKDKFFRKGCFMKIDHAQLNAIRHKDGPAMVLAGPGSGKTTVITRRVQSLIEEHQIPPNHILVITFTRAAAIEMRTRFQRLMGNRKLPVTFGTFHSVFFMMLRHAYGYTAEQIVKEEQRVSFIREFIHRLRLEYDDEMDFISGILSEISLVKNTDMDLQHYYSANCSASVFRKIYQGYQEFLEQNCLLDFDDMLIFTKELLEQREDILNAWRQKFQYILIDEFQDINQIQYEIVQLLAAPRNNLFIVGDDDQSIYRFRGARPEIMLGFEKDYPNAASIILNTNYRSGKDIVQHSGRLISRNQIRYPKDICAARERGLPVIYHHFKDQREQNLFVIRKIMELKRQAGLEYGDIAILSRTNMQCRFLMEQMLDYNVPFTSRDRIPNIYEHWIAQDIFTYIRLAQGDRSRASFLKIMNRPKRYLSRESLPYEDVAFEVWEDYYKKQDWMVQRLHKLEGDLNVIARMRPYSAINYIRKGIPYEDYLREFAEMRKVPLEDLMDILDELQENAKGFDHFSAWMEHIQKVQEELAERTEHHMDTEDAVHFSTLHSAKGLEFDTVFLVDVNEKVMPNKKAVLDADLEEERRIFYVGMTRAKNRLYIFSNGQINHKEMEPSRFIAESQT